jgi:hypothetical protein
MAWLIAVLNLWICLHSQKSQLSRSIFHVSKKIGQFQHNVKTNFVINYSHLQVHSQQYAASIWYSPADRRADQVIRGFQICPIRFLDGLLGLPILRRMAVADGPVADCAPDI